MNVRSLAVVALTISLMAGCAKRPDAIVATAIPTSAYSNMSCPELSSELISENTKLASLSKTQNRAATADAFGVFLVGVPAGSLVGADKEGEVALSKGKVVAVESNIKQKRC